MNSNELNKYILNYCKNDNTQLAIMLTGDWGIGKSYYIKNSLMCELQKGDIHCAYVSLYGITSIAEISKSLYFELRFKKILDNTNKFKCKHKKEVANYAVLAAKTIVKGISSYFNVSLDISQCDIEKVYKSIDLKNKLIILDDFERTDIDVEQLLGFINNLCEHDGAKVLIVTSEKELISKLNSSNNLAQYKSIKEKTVGDTILFSNDISNALCNIIKSFNNSILNTIWESDSKELIDSISRLMGRMNSHNLRQVRYACQKTINIITSLGDEDYSIFMRELLLRNIVFCLLNMYNLTSNYNDYEKLLTKNRIWEHKIFPSCYNYFMNGKIDKTQYYTDKNNYLNSLSAADKDYDLSVIFDFYNNSEQVVLSAIHNTYKKLKNGQIPALCYGSLGNYLIAISEIIDEKIIDSCLNQLIKNAEMYFAKNPTADELVITSGYSLESVNSSSRLDSFIQDLNKSYSLNNEKYTCFDLSSDGIKHALSKIDETRSFYASKKAFISRLNNDKLIEFIRICSVRDLRLLRKLFYNIYNYYSPIEEHFNDDINGLIEFKKSLNEILDVETDRIKKYGLRHFISDIESYLKSVSP